MSMTELSVEERYQQINTFVGLFVTEFMAEIAFLESVARGNAPERKDASMVMLFNISCGLVSLVPIPGITLGFVALPHVVKAVVDIGRSIVRQPLIQEAMTAARDYLTKALTSEIQDRLTLTSPALSVTENNQSVDKEIMQVLVRWVGTQLSCRYEQALTERLSIQAEKALADLAREAARRSVAFLAENPAPHGSQAACMHHLLSGVAIGQKVKWYLRPLELLHKKELQGRDEAASLTFHATSLLAGGVWFQGDAFYTRNETKWIERRMLFSTTGLEGLPKYGYTQGWVEGIGLTEYQGVTPDFSEWQNRRVFHAITKQDLIDYLNSDSVQTARAQQTTAAQTLTKFLHARSPSHFPAYATLYITEELRDLVFAHGNFQRVDFSGSQFAGDFSYADFSYGKFYACGFYKVFSEAHSRVIFTHSILSFSNFIEAKFKGIVDVVQAELCRVDLDSAQFGRVDYIGANWYRANLRDVNYEKLREAQTEQIDVILKRQQRQEDILLVLNKRILNLENQHTEYCTSHAWNAEQQKKIDSLLTTEINFITFQAYTELQLEKLQGKYEENRIAIAQLTQQLEALRRELARLVWYDHATSMYPSRFYTGHKFNQHLWVISFVNENNTMWELVDRSQAKASIVVEGMRNNPDGVMCMFVAKYTLIKKDNGYKIISEELDIPIENHVEVITRSGTDFIDDILSCLKLGKCSWTVHKPLALKMMGKTEDAEDAEDAEDDLSIRSIIQDASLIDNVQSTSMKSWTIGGFFYDRFRKPDDPVERFIYGNATDISPVEWCIKKLKLAGINHIMPLGHMASSAAAGSSAHQKNKPKY